MQATSSNGMSNSRYSDTNRLMTRSRILTGGADAPLLRRSELVSE